MPVNVLGLGALNEREALANLLDALSIAENAARQMALHTDRPQWMLVANQFGTMRTACSQLGQASLLVVSG